MAQLHQAKLKSSDKSSGHMYRTRRNRKSTQTKLTLKKYDPKLRKHVEYVEMKK